MDSCYLSWQAWYVFIYISDGPGCIFPLFYLKTAYLAPKISSVFYTLIRTKGFSTSWRVGNVTPLSKFGSASTCPSDSLPVTFTPVVPKVTEWLLANHQNTSVEKKNLIPNLQLGFCKGVGLWCLSDFYQFSLGIFGLWL